MYVGHQAKEIDLLFSQVRMLYIEMLSVVSKVSKIDFILAKDIFNLSSADAALLKQNAITENVIAEAVKKNSFLFTVYMPEYLHVTQILLESKSDFSGFKNEEIGVLCAMYDKLQMRVMIRLKEIINKDPIIAKQLFDLDDTCLKTLVELDLEYIISLSSRYAWLVLLNNKRTASVFNETVNLRSHNDLVFVDSIINY